MEQLGFEGMPRRLYACTPTRLTTWLNCPRQYRMAYLDRPAAPKGPPWAHNSLGASVHNALAGWWRLPRKDRTVSAAGDLLDQGWLSDGFADDQQSAAHRRRCRTLVENYVATLDPAAEPAGVERTVATRTELIAVSGRIDRLDDRRAQNPGPGDGAGVAETTQWQRELVVVDYKTGRHQLTVDDARSSLALALYALAAGRVLRRPCSRVELHHLPTGRVLGWDHTPESLARQLGRAESIAAECADADERYQAQKPAEASPPAHEDFPPRPGPGCGWCDYRSLCPEGRAASAHRRPWDGLDEPVPADAAPLSGAAAATPPR
jgi:RecB family exonuclease